MIVDLYQTEIVEQGRTALAANLRYRLTIRLRAERDAGFRRAVTEACRHDVLWWMNTFCWLHEPRPMRDASGRILPEVIPFITWPHQNPIILECRKRLGFEDIGIEKSRGEGMSWIAILLAMHDWIFAKAGTRLVKIGFVSRTMEMAYTPNDMDSLLQKCIWELGQLPTWMVGEEKVGWKLRQDGATLTNFRNGATISAYSSTGEVGSGGRYTWFFMDELSKFERDKEALTSTQATTHSRLIGGTPYGAQGAYYDVMHEPSSMVKLVLAWEQNPTRNRGLYRMVNGVPVAVDPKNNPLPAHYNPPTQEVLDLFSRLRRKGFRLDKGVRSPWYDKECDRPNATPYNIAQELDRDYGGSMYLIFTEDFFKEATANVRPPFCHVHVDYDSQLKPRVSRANDGLMALWMTLDSRNRPPEHPYVVSCDISTGLGGTYTSNSVIEIIDTLTMRQAGELAANTIEPDDFADLAVAVCNWLGNAYLAWEVGGPGNAFTNRIKEIGYRNVYLRTKIFDSRRGRKVRELGWATNHKSKEVLFSELKRIVVTGELTILSDALVKECRHYIRVGRSIEHTANVRGVEGPDAGESHGDRVMAFGVGIQALADRPARLLGEPDPSVIQPGSIEERDRVYFESLRQVEDDWDDRSNWDLMAGRSKGSGDL